MQDYKDKDRTQRWFKRGRRQEPSNQMQARTVQISTACLAPQHKFAVSEEYPSSAHRCLNWVLFGFSEHLGNSGQQAQMQISILLLLNTR